MQNRTFYLDVKKKKKEKEKSAFEMVLLIPINFQNSAGELQAVFISFKSNCKPLNGLCRTESEVNRDFCIKRVMTSFLNTCNPAFFFLLYNPVFSRFRCILGLYSGAGTNEDERY